jgi:hypothetical protein
MENTDIKDLQLNHTYLIRYGLSDIVSSVTILLITDKAYHIRWNRGLQSNDTWELKELLNRNYNMVEDISDFILGNLQTTTGKELIMEVKTKNVTCYICHGLGTIPDPGSTGGTKVCPRCLGAKMTPEVSEITSR